MNRTYIRSQSSAVTIRHNGGKDDEEKGERNESTSISRNHRNTTLFGYSFFKTGQIVHLIKEPDNSHDHEAIKVEIVPIGKIGYVANSKHTVPRGCLECRPDI